jgi:hypothetical protein
MRKNTMAMAGLLVLAAAVRSDLSWGQADLNADPGAVLAAAGTNAAAEPNIAPRQQRNATRSCNVLVIDPALGSALQTAAQAPFEIYYVGHEYSGGRESYYMEKIEKVPCGIRGAQPFFDFDEKSQSECISGDYASAAPFIKLLAQAFLEQGKITAIKFAGMRDQKLVIDAAYKTTGCGYTPGDDSRPSVPIGHYEGEGSDNFPQRFVCDQPVPVVSAGVLTYSPCPTSK